MSASATTPLTVEGLSVARGDVLLIEALSFALRAGEALHVVGENGAGKSTLLLALAGLIPAASGTVTIDRDGLAFLGHDNGLLPDLTVSENLALYERSGVEPSVDVVVTLGVEALMAKPARTLSFGQARRVALALTCLPDKQLWMLDEPLAGLDQQTAAALQSLLAANLQQGKSLVFTSHERGLEDVSRLDLDSHRSAHV
ncbi:MAG: heme ABC exporter ATP-binding protein CcmA [Alphaproteobacteria bacterium TMED89]|nr:heme ABC exporter ATP-binding protein CcmA [Rhodospirillaceae bacterium]RPH16900.1 MAG: heme ABC exporter ATP-binding protein CcmA [Alphaproteobacteria bacterium TMED89]